MNETTATIVRWIVTLALPFLFGFFMLTFTIAPWYPEWEYDKASFPADDFGWTQQQRLDLALVAVDFLSRPEPAEDAIYLLAEQTMPDSGQPLYNERELDHMVDVKVRADRFRRAAWALAIVVVAGLTALLYRRHTEQEAYLAVRNGGIATIIILAVIGGTLLLFWDFFFVTFHELLFPPGTWTFSYSDSLIRLFPNKFWFDYGVVVVGGTLLLGVVATLIGQLLLRRPDRR